MPSAPAIAIREAGADDAARLALIGGATFLEAFAEQVPGDDILAHIRNVHNVDAYADALADPATRGWLAEIAETGSPVGYQLLCAPDLPIELDPGDLEIKRIYLFARYHGDGTARRMIDRAVAHARARRAPRLLIGVNAENRRAIGFYEKCGFVTAGERYFTVGSQRHYDKIFALAL
ncbi:MAG: GNAT family N-acetyltransferase [Sphingomonadales bacterium]|nr:GNAT family N-acetyltransferase [Sphingomonadales bacterium]